MTNTKFNKQGYVYLKKIHMGWPEVAFVEGINDDGLVICRTRFTVGTFGSLCKVTRGLDGKPNAEGVSKSGHGDIVCYVTDDNAYELCKEHCIGEITMTEKDHMRQKDNASIYE